MRPEPKIQPDPAFTARGRSFTGLDPRAPLRDALMDANQYHPTQSAGRFYPMACVALEITQRCNLDCTLCYLSENAEQAFDVPLPILFQRIDSALSHYGPGTTIQITGGDPTLRKIADIETLCQRIRALGLRSCLMTNGIRATRPYLARLAEAGLDDVAFHVDLTQERRGFDSEEALNWIRHDYIQRARRLGLRILFNTTIYNGNLAELPMLCRFFRDHAHHLSLVSFQMQAETGRGTAETRNDSLTQDRVAQGIAEGFGASFPSDIAIGHSDCSRYDHLLIAGDKAVSLLRNTGLMARVFKALEKNERSGEAVARIRPMVLRAALRNPMLALRVTATGAAALWRLLAGIWQSRKRPARLSVMVHSFMDAKSLVPDRCASCVFMVMTRDGPMSMCAFNAERDHQLFLPVAMDSSAQPKWWSAATGEVSYTPVHAAPSPAPFKKMKGRQRATALRRRKETST